MTSPLPWNLSQRYKLPWMMLSLSSLWRQFRRRAIQTSTPKTEPESSHFLVGTMVLCPLLWLGRRAAAPLTAPSWGLADFHPLPRRVSPIWAGRVAPDLDQKLLAPGELLQQLLPMHLLQTPAQLHLHALLGTPAGIPQQTLGQAHLSEAGQPGLHHPRLWRADPLSNHSGLLHKLH